MNLSRLDHDAIRLYTVLADGGLALARTTTGFSLFAMKSDAVARLHALRGAGPERRCQVVGTMAVLDDVAATVAARTRASLVRAARAHRPLVVVGRTNGASFLLGGLERSVVEECTSGETISVGLGGGALGDQVALVALTQGRLVVESCARGHWLGESAALAAVPRAIRVGVDIIVDHGSEAAVAPRVVYALGRPPRSQKALAVGPTGAFVGAERSAA